MWPVFARPNFGQALNLVDATLASQSGLHSSYSTALKPLSQCSTCGPFATMRAAFQSPTGFKCPSGDGYKPYAAAAQVRRVLLSAASASSSSWYSGPVV